MMNDTVTATEILEVLQNNPNGLSGWELSDFLETDMDNFYPVLRSLEKENLVSSYIKNSIVRYFALDVVAANERDGEDQMLWDMDEPEGIDF